MGSFQINTKYLAPLFLEYDDRLREKENIIRHCEVGTVLNICTWNLSIWTLTPLLTVVRFCYLETRSSAQGNCSVKSLGSSVVDSSLSSLSSTSHAGQGGFGVGGVWGRGPGWGRGVWGEAGIHLAIYCTTTWCFALKGLRTINSSESRTRLCMFPRVGSFSVRIGRVW